MPTPTIPPTSSGEVDALRGLFQPVGSNKIKEEQFRLMTLRGEGILKKAEIAEELDAGLMRVKHCEHFDKKKVAELVAETLQEFLDEGDYKQVRGVTKRDGSDLLTTLCEALEEQITDTSGNLYSWQGASGFALELSMVCDIVLQLPSGYWFYFWKGEAV